MPDLRELEKLTLEEAEATLRRRKARKLRRTNGRLATNKVNVTADDAAALVAWPVLEAFEIIWLYRRRAHVLQRVVARDLGVSRLWVNRMEMGLEDPTRLIEYWEC